MQFLTSQGARQSGAAKQHWGPSVSHRRCCRRRCCSAPPSLAMLSRKPFLVVSFVFCRIVTTAGRTTNRRKMKRGTLALAGNVLSIHLVRLEVHFRPPRFPRVPSVLLGNVVLSPTVSSVLPVLTVLFGNAVLIPNVLRVQSVLQVLFGNAYWFPMCHQSRPSWTAPTQPGLGLPAHHGRRFTARM